MSDVQIDSDKPRRGRPPNQKPAQAIRPSREGRVEVLGRDGQVLTRKRVGHIDPYFVPPHLKPDGWDYQWNPYSVHGEIKVDLQLAMAENGWTPVPADRHPGIFMPVGATGQILRGGLRLEERPIELTMEAKREEKKEADAQLRDQSAQYGKFKNALGQGFDSRAFLPGNQINRTGIDAATDAPRPQYDIDTP